jgi:hypothetical protein
VISTDAANNSSTSPISSFITTNTASVWNTSVVPAVITDNDPNAVELGMKFRSDAAGQVIGVRFYKGATNTGTHLGNLWSATGQLLATVTFSNETASGWQQATFPTPVSINPNTTYIISYHTQVGMYSHDNNYFTSQGAQNPPLRALQSGVDGPNGLYRYGATGFPNQSYQDTNYWVDVVFK